MNFERIKLFLFDARTFINDPPMRSFCLRFLFLIAILLFHDAPLRAADFAFSNLMTESVWNHRVVYSIAKDQHGLIWIGTDNGLYRYNGYQYRYYSQPELNNNTINKLFLSERDF